MMQIKDEMVAGDDTAMCFNYAFDEAGTSSVKTGYDLHMLSWSFGFHWKCFFSHKIHMSLDSVESLVEALKCS